MFDVGFSEILICAVLALIILGPERLPVVARQCGRMMGRIRQYTSSLTAELERETKPGLFQQHVLDVAKAVKQEAQDFKQTVEAAGASDEPAGEAKAAVEAKVEADAK